MTIDPARGRGKSRPRRGWRDSRTPVLAPTPSPRDGDPGFVDTSTAWASATSAEATPAQAARPAARIIAALIFFGGGAVCGVGGLVAFAVACVGLANATSGNNAVWPNLAVTVAGLGVLAGCVVGLRSLRRFGALRYGPTVEERLKAVAWTRNVDENLKEIPRVVDLVIPIRLVVGLVAIAAQLLAIVVPRRRSPTTSSGQAPRSSP